MKISILKFLFILIFSYNIYPKDIMTNDFYIHDSLSNILEVKDKQNKSSLNLLEEKYKPLLWRTNNLNIHFQSLDKKKIFEDNNFHNLMFVITFDSFSLQAEKLKNHHATTLFYQKEKNDRGIALVKPQNKKELEEFAHIAHEGKYPMCGNIIQLGNYSLTQIENQEIKHDKNIYESYIRLNKVTELIKKIDSNKIIESINTLGEFTNRYHSTEEGAKVPLKIIDMVKSISSDYTLKSEIIKLDHSYEGKQDNVVITIEGTEEDRKEELVLVGAHMDTILRGLTPSGSNKGADDDASGIAVWLEVLRVISSNKLKFKRSIQFHAYAAEEVGLIGSRQLAKNYRKENKNVISMLQLDMTMFSEDPTSKTIYLVSNDTSPILRRSLKNLLNIYFDGDYQEMRLSGGTSDHVSWKNQRFPVVFPFEHPTNYNKALHTTKDTIDTAQNKDLAVRFAQLVLAHLSHNAGLVAAEDDYKKSTSEISNQVNIAIVKNKDKNNVETSFWDVAISVDPKVYEVEVCRSISSEKQSCLNRMHILNNIGKKQNRNIFMNQKNDPITIDNKQHLLVLAYDINGSLVFKRNILLEKK